MTTVAMPLRLHIARRIRTKIRLARTRAGLYFAVGGILLFSVPIPPSHAGQAKVTDAHQWLDRMSHAERALNFEGTFVYRRGDKLVGMKVTHVVDKLGERERLVTLNGDRREVIRDHNGVTCILPDEHLVVVSKSRLSKPFPAKLIENPDVLQAHYDIVAAGQSRTMGETSQVIVVKPRDKYRYGYRLWIDKNTGLMLQSDVLDKDGRIVEQIMFTSLKLLTKIPPSVEEKIHPAANTVLKSNRSVLVKDDHKWRVEDMPDGFKLIEHRKRTRSTAGHVASMDHLVFTDGLASVSVFIENQLASRQAARMIGVSHVGAVNAFRTVVGDHQVTVVGEVPISTVRRIGESISYHVTH